ncbi:MAG: indole-3-glycerol phosphate synthase TrpC [Micavibrio sp.]
MSNILQKICADKREHIAHQKAQTPLAALKEQIESLPPARGFIGALQANPPALIAEIKKASPSKGIIRADFDPVAIARIYAENGAACLSVLTDEPYFQGCDSYLQNIRAAVDIPLLRKDFTVDPYQLYEARALGADCILLIMAALEENEASDMYDLATSLSLDTLFEVHDEEELERALALSPRMIGVNNRNLKTLEVDIATGLNLAPSIPDGILKVAESGLADHDTVEAFHALGYGAFLIGESLMRAHDIGAATRKIMSKS